MKCIKNCPRTLEILLLKSHSATRKVRTATPVESTAIPEGDEGNEGHEDDKR